MFDDLCWVKVDGPGVRERLFTDPCVEELLHKAETMTGVEEFGVYRSCGGVHFLIAVVCPIMPNDAERTSSRVSSRWLVIQKSCCKELHKSSTLT